MHAPIISGTVLAHGCFDMLHLGHVRHLKEAKALGSRLVVSVTSDRHVSKGAGRPHFGQEQRMEMLRALSFVDEVVLNDTPDAVAIIEATKPSVYVKGIDYTDSTNAGLEREREAITKLGGRLHITTTSKWSSSRLLNEAKFDEQTCRFLDYARGGQYRDRIMEAFERADKLKVAFVGETIIDEYRYVRALGKTSKEYTIATVECSRESFQGGVAAAARHAEWPNAYVVTGPSLTKTRYVDADFSRKLFEVYSEKNIALTPGDRAIFRMELGHVVNESDAVILFDFGHGLLGPMEREALGTAKFLAVNAQSNAGNYGFNRVTNYRNAHLVCVDDPEARLATGIQHDTVDNVVRVLFSKLGCPVLVVTNGRHGSVAQSIGRTVTIPVFSDHVVDTMGAGDAFLAVAAPLVAAGLPVEMAAFAGNVAGAIKVSIVGHRRHVTRHELVATIETLLK